MNKTELEAKVKDLHDAMKGSGTDEPALIRATMGYTKAQRQEMRQLFKTSYGKDLQEILDKELSGNFKDVMVGLYDTAVEFDAKTLYKAMKGMGTDEDALIEIICTRSAADLKQIKAEFQKLYNKDLVKEVESDTSGDLKNLLASILQCNRSNNANPNDEQCKQDAHQLYTAGEGKKGTDEEFFNKIFATRSPQELMAINKWYTKLSNKHLATSIDKEFSGNIKKALLSILESSTSPAEYFAKVINKAIKGMGTNDNMLIRTLISREEIDMTMIRAQYEALFKKKMIDDITGDTSGDYQKICVAIAMK